MQAERERSDSLEKGFERRLQMVRSRLVVLLSHVDPGRSIVADMPVDEILTAL